MLDPEAHQRRPARRDELVERPRRAPQREYVCDEQLAQDLDEELVGQEQKRPV